MRFADVEQSRLQLCFVVSSLKASITSYHIRGNIESHAASLSGPGSVKVRLYNDSLSTSPAGVNKAVFISLTDPSLSRTSQLTKVTFRVCLRIAKLHPYIRAQPSSKEHTGQA